MKGIINICSNQGQRGNLVMVDIFLNECIVSGKIKILPKFIYLLMMVKVMQVTADGSVSASSCKSCMDYYLNSYYGTCTKLVMV